MGKGLLDTLFSECDGCIELRAILPKKPTIAEFFQISDAAGMTAFIKKHRDRNIYFGCSTRDGSGGELKNVVHVPSVWVDLDWKGYPGGRTDAEEALAGFPLPPTITVQSGGGFHCYWKLKEPCTLEDEPKLKSIMRALANRLGGDMSCAEVARILRVPHTLNHKYAPPRKVVLQHCNGSEFSLSDFDFLPEAEEIERPHKSKQDHRESLNRIMQCEFMQHCKNNAAALSEPMWYAMISQLAREQGGIDLIHILSKPYKGYKRSETDRKILQATNASGPHT